ncbi:hypothetical protein [Thermus tengchongensis]|uniref:hypothetical protein n=1 Tax=Thermus tengchongensis TaxID=1214928 RepID=UPI00068FA005|nr:hypothetical protein [Thermus tengchongensis]
MTLREALSQVPDPRAHPHLLPHLGLRKPPGHTALTELLHRLDPQASAQALAAVFPETEREGEKVLVADGKVLRGSGKGKNPQVRLVEAKVRASPVTWAHSLGRTLAQARAEGSEQGALLERLGAGGLAGKVVVGDAGFLYPEVARGVRAKGGSTSWS